MKHLLLIALLIPTLASATTTPVCLFAEQRLAEVQTDWSHAGFFKAKKPMGGKWRENLARKFYSQERVYQAWMNSPSHRENLLASSTESCLRTANGHWVLITWEPHTKVTSPK